MHVNVKYFVSVYKSYIRVLLHKPYLQLVNVYVFFSKFLSVLQFKFQFLDRNLRFPDY